MKRLSRRDLEAIADRVIRAYMKLPEITDRPVFRIYPEILAEKLLGLKIDYQHLSVDGSILGMTSFGRIGIELPRCDDSGEVYLLDGKTVLIETDLRENVEFGGRKNFTIMHELSHQVLKILVAHQEKEGVVKMAKKVEVPVWERFTITVEEAAQYFGIGSSKLRELSNEDNCPFVLWVGNKRLIKRRKLEEYLTELKSI